MRHFALRRLKGIRRRFNSSGYVNQQSENIMLGYGESMAGIDYAYTDISDRAMWETYLPPFEAGVKAGVTTLMTGFNDINGTPAVYHEYLIKDVLRGKVEL